MNDFEIADPGADRNVKNYHVKFISSEKLDAPEKLLLMVLLSMRNLAEIHITIDLLAEHTSLSTATVKRKLASLKEKGFIERRGRGRSLPTITEINHQAIRDAVRETVPKMAAKFYDLPF